MCFVISVYSKTRTYATAEFETKKEIIQWLHSVIYSFRADVWYNKENKEVYYTQARREIMSFFKHYDLYEYEVCIYAEWEEDNVYKDFEGINYILGIKDKEPVYITIWYDL